MPDRTVVEWDKDDLDDAADAQDRLACARHAVCIRAGSELAARASRRGLALAGGPGRGPGGLRDAVAGRHYRRVSGREPGADVDAAAAQAEGVLRSGHRGARSSGRGRSRDDMVHPYLRRRARKSVSPVAVPYPNGADPQRSWSKTLGVPLFQEQAMQLAVVAAGFTPGEAEGRGRSRCAGARRRRGSGRARRPACRSRRAGGG